LAVHTKLSDPHAAKFLGVSQFAGVSFHSGLIS
jgi:hypothetical protein